MKQGESGNKAGKSVDKAEMEQIYIHCMTAEPHVPLNFKSMESGLMTNVITPASF